MDRKDDTMNLDALKEMLSDVPDSGEFDLDSIIAEVAGGAPAEPKKAPQPAEEPPKAQPAAEEKRPQGKKPARTPEERYRKTYGDPFDRRHLRREEPGRGGKGRRNSWGG